MRTYVYKLTSDRGGAPCAPPPVDGAAPLLSLSICKPAIRRTAQPGDRILGITSHSLAASDGYPLCAVIYAAIVAEAKEPREYYAPESPFGSRPDCIYRFHAELGKLLHGGHTPLHADERYEPRDIGSYPFYRNARTLLSHEFRYFGAAAVPLTHATPLLLHAAESLAQGHRVFEAGDAEVPELDRLFKRLWKRQTLFTPAAVHAEAPGHAPTGKAARGSLGKAALGDPNTLAQVAYRARRRARGVC